MCTEHSACHGFIKHSASEKFIRSEHSEMIIVDDTPAALINKIEQYEHPISTKVEWAKKQSNI